MNQNQYTHDDFDPDGRSRKEKDFKKLKRPIHASKRSNSPERLRGMHRRRRKRMDW